MNQTNIQQAGFGGGCHWCTEAVFASLKGVADVQQGWVASAKPYDNFSEAVLVKYDASAINLEALIEVHVSTHAATSKHSMRHKYRSAIYYFNEADKLKILDTLSLLNASLNQPLITKVLPFVSFKLNKKEFQKYYHSNPDKPFCKVHIQPKIDLLKTQFNNLL